MEYQVDDANKAWDFWRKWQDGTWEPTTKSVIDKYVQGGTYVDIGAWIGPTVLWAAPLASRVVAIEPDPIAFKMLINNTRHFPNVEYHDLAISDQDAWTTIEPSGNSMTRVGDGNHTVVSCTVESLFEELNITEADLIKIDIEGHEREVLIQAEPFLKEFGTPIMLSLHDWAPWESDLLPGWHRTEFTSREWLVTP